MAFRDGPFENIKVPLSWAAAVVVFVGVVASIFLMATDRTDRLGQRGHASVRAGFESVVGPVNGVLAWPGRWGRSVSDSVGGYFGAVSENRRLKARIVELEAWRDEAIALKNVNARYESLLGIRTDPPVPMTSARSISDTRGPFGNARLIDAGTAKGIQIGNPVINQHGLVGRVVGATASVSRVVRVTDVASRVPVMIERSDARALLTGDGSGNPRLAYVRGQQSVQAGDRILTSGDGGGIPRGIPVGIAAVGLDGSWRVKLFTDRSAVDYVNVLLFRDFGQLTDAEALNAPPLAGLSPAAIIAEPAPVTDQAGPRP